MPHFSLIPITHHSISRSLHAHQSHIDIQYLSERTSLFIQYLSVIEAAIVGVFGVSPLVLLGGVIVERDIPARFVMISWEDAKTSQHMEWRRLCSRYTRNKNYGREPKIERKSDV